MESGLEPSPVTGAVATLSQPCDGSSNEMTVSVPAAWAHNVLLREFSVPGRSFDFSRI